MTDTQLYLAIGVPMLMNGLLFLALNNRIGSLETRIAALEGSFTARFDLIMGKMTEMDSRLSVLKDRLQR